MPPKLIKASKSICWFLLFILVFPLAGFSQNASFSINGTPIIRNQTINVCQGNSLLFGNLTSFGISGVSWRFENGNPATSTAFGSVNVTYNGVGSGLAVQTITRFDGTRDSARVNVVVSNTFPKAGFNISPTTEECGNTNFSFTSTSTGNGLRYLWNFGDTRTSTLQNPTHAFNRAIGNTGTETYNVRLIVTNAGGCSDTLERPITVRRIPDITIRPPDAQVLFGNFNGRETFRRCNNQPNFEFSFANLSTTTNTGYTINWGDGSPTLTLPAWPAATPQQHTYTRGNHVMTVTTTGPNGCTNTRQYNVFLGTNPAAGFSTPGNTEICAPDELPFIISGVANNAPGTLYSVRVNDGSALANFSHPPPDTVRHLFQNSSCGITSNNGAQTFINSYFSVLDVENPCGSTSISVIPIYVSGKPNPQISAPPNICTNTPATIGNSGSYGGSITSTGGGSSTCDDVGKQVWTISPATGYTINSGTLGNLNGNAINGFFWTNGSRNVGITFTTPGTYTVWQYLSNDRCGVDSISREICVRLPATASFTMNKRSGCNPDTVRITNTSPVGPCGGESYQWEVRHLDPQSCVSGNGQFTFISGTTSSSANPQIRFAQVGLYEISLTLRTAAIGCTPVVVRDTFTVRGSPQVSLNVPPGVCVGNSITPQATVSGCYSSGTPAYAWSFTGGSPVSGNQLNPGAVTYNNSGNYQVLLTVTDQCGETTASQTVAVGPLPIANAGPDRNVCSGSSVAIGSPGIGGVLYSWQPATGLSNAALHNPTLTATYTGPNTDTVLTYVVTASLGATCQSTDTVLVQVRQAPQLSIAPAAPVICPGGSIQLTAYGAETYQWSGGPVAGRSDTAIITVNPTAASTTYLVTGTVANGCTGTASRAVLVTAVPQVSAGPDITACTNASAFQLAGSPAGGTWSGTGVSPAGIFNPGTSGTGSFKVYYTINVAGCSGIDSTVITIQNPPVVSAGRDTAFCTQPGTYQLAGTPAGGVWSGATFVTAGGLVALNVPGTYLLVYTIGSGLCVNTDTMQLIVGNAISNNTITPVAAVCPGATPARINGSTATAGSFAISYQWQQSADSLNWENIAGATTLFFDPPLPTATIFYRRVASSTLCSGGSPSPGVAIRINPNAQAILAPPATVGCAPFSLTHAAVGLQHLTDRNSTYQWFANGNPLGSGLTFPGFTILQPDDSLTIRVIAISRFGCRPDTAAQTFYTAPAALPSFTLSDTVGCGPLTVSIINNTPSPERFQFFWNFGNGQTSTSANPPPIILPINPMLGDTLYRAVLRATAGCDTIQQVQWVRVRAPAKAIISPDKVQGCSPAVFTFTNNSRGSNAGFTWNFGDGTPDSATQATQVQHTYNTGSQRFYTVSLSTANSCGADTARLTVLVTPNPIRLNMQVNANQLNGCAPHTVQFINNTLGATFYRYEFGDGTTLNSSSTFDTVVHVYANPGTYIMRITAGNACTDTTATRTIEVRNAPRAAFTQSTFSACIGQPVSFASESTPGALLQWRFGDGSSSVVPGPVRPYTMPGTYRVVLYASTSFGPGFLCTDSAVGTIIIRDTLPGSFTADSTGSCAPTVYTFKTNRQPATTTWTFGNGMQATGDSVTQVFANAGNYLVNMVSREAGGCVYVAERLIRVEGPAGQLIYPPGYACAGSPVPIEVITNNTGRFIYFFGNGDSLISTSNRITYTYTQPGLYVPRVLLQSGNCAKWLVGTDTIRVDRVQAAIVQAATPFCGTTTYRFTDAGSSYFGKAGWQWQFGDGTGSTLANPQKNYTQPGNYNIRLLLTGLSGCTDSAALPLRADVEPVPATTIVADAAGCIGQPLAFAALVQNAGTIASYNWNFGNGVTGTGRTTTATYQQAGLYTATLISRTPFGCADTASHTVRVSMAPIVNAGPDIRLCLGQSTVLTARGADTWQWTPANGLSCTTCSSPTVQPAATTSYIVNGSNAFGCASSDTVLVQVVQPFRISYSRSDSICIGQSLQLSAGGAFRYQWQPATGLSNAATANPVARPTVSTTYMVVGFDNFNCFTDTGYITVGVGLIPTVQLGPGAQVVAGTQVTFSPQVTNGPIVRYTWTPATNLSCTNCPNPTVAILNNTNYTLQVANAYGCTATDTIGYRVVCNKAEQLYIPNAFSPDGDGVNDVLMVRGKGLARVRYFRVFNRFGQVVFERSNFEANDPRYGWDGRINGVPAAPDVYVYMADVICSAGETYFEKGNVTLVR